MWVINGVVTVATKMNGGDVGDDSEVPPDAQLYRYRDLQLQSLFGYSGRLREANFLDFKGSAGRACCNDLGRDERPVWGTAT